MKIVLVVPTKDRPIDIQNLFASIITQTRKPDLVIIVDGSDNPIESIVTKFSDRINLKYYPCRPPSLPRQRNVGIANLPTDTDWLGFLDDDLVLENDTVESLEKFIIAQNNPRLKGIGMSIINQPPPRESIFNNLFLMSVNAPGKITSAGYPTPIPFVTKDVKTDWIYGGATFWAADIFKNFNYDEWFAGTGYLEDVDFSYRVSRKYDLMISSTVKCNHYDHGVSLIREASRAEWQLTAWWYFVNKYKDFSIFAVSWAMFGLVLKSHLMILASRNQKHTQRARGFWKGIRRILNGTALEFKGFSK
jgi:glycosyltransferase involved in cell wall biosynthesis